MIDPVTGEIRSTAEAWADLRARVDRFVAMEEVPSEIERMQIAAEALASEMADFLKATQDEVDDKQSLYSVRLAKEMQRLGDKRWTQTVVNKVAEAEAIEEKRDLNHAQSIHDHVRRKLAALTQKHYGLMNRNRTVQGMAGAAHRRTV